MTNFNALPLSEKLTHAQRGDIVVTDSGARLPFVEHSPYNGEFPKVQICNISYDFLSMDHIIDIIRPEPETKPVPEIDEMLHDIRNYLLASQANTLPLDEIPNGWEFRSIEKVWDINAEHPHYTCHLDSGDCDDVLENGDTLHESMCNAIEQAKEVVK